MYTRINGKVYTVITSFVSGAGLQNSGLLYRRSLHNISASPEILHAHVPKYPKFKVVPAVTSRFCGVSSVCCICGTSHGRQMLFAPSWSALVVVSPVFWLVLLCTPLAAWQSRRHGLNLPIGGLITLYAVFLLASV